MVDVEDKTRPVVPNKIGECEVWCLGPLGEEN